MHPNRTKKAVVIILALLALASGISFAVVRQSSISESQDSLTSRNEPDLSLGQAEIDETSKTKLTQFVFPGKTKITFLYPTSWSYFGNQDNGSGSIGIFNDAQNRLVGEFWIGRFNPLPLQYKPISESRYGITTNSGLSGTILIRHFAKTSNAVGLSGTDFWFVHDTGIQDIGFLLRVVGQDASFQPIFKKMIDSLKVDASWRVR